MTSEKQRKERRKRIMTLVGDFSWFFLGCIIVGILVFMIQGWTFSGNGAQQSGLVQFGSYPLNAVVEIGQRTLFGTTNTKATVLPGEYEFKIWKEGYETWYKKTEVSAGQLLWLNYARLVPKQKNEKIFDNLSGVVKQAAVSPNSQRIVMVNSDESNNPTFQTVDIRNDEPVFRNLPIDVELFYRPALPEVDSDAVQTELEIQEARLSLDLEFNLASQIQIHAISKNSNYMILKQVHEDGVNWLLIDIERPERSQNLTRTFGVNFDQLEISSDDASRILVRTGSTIRQLNTQDGNISAVLVSDVTDLKVFEDQAVGFVQTQKADDKFSVGIMALAGGNQTPVIVARNLIGPDIQIGRYFNENYLHIYDEQELMIYKSSSWPVRGSNFQLVKMIETDFKADFIQLNDEQRFVILSNDSQILIHDLELDLDYQVARDKSSDAEKNAAKPTAWLDEYVMYGFNSDNQLVIKDFDGLNKHALMEADSSLPALLNNSGKYIYAFRKIEAKNDDGVDYHHQLVQLKMNID